MNTKRELYLDSLKFFAIFHVMGSHFIDSAKNINNDFFASRLFKMISCGKFGVAIFAIILGYLSYLKGKKKKENVIIYCIKRYAYFVLCGFVVNCLCYLTNYCGIREIANFNYVIGQSILLGYNIYPTYWFAFSFFFGSVISYIVGFYDIKTDTCLILAALFVMLSVSNVDNVFIGACLLGPVLYMALDNIKIKDSIISKTIEVVLLILVSICITYTKRNLFRNVVYIICSFILIYIVKNNKTLYKIANNKFLSFLGRSTMSILLTHILLIEPTISYCFSLNINIYMTYILYLIICIVISIPLDFLITKTLSYVNKLIDYTYLTAC